MKSPTVISMSQAALFIVLLGLVTAISWGIADYFAARASKSLGPIMSAFLVNIIGVLLFVVIYFVFLHPQVSITLEGLLFAATGGAAITIGAIALFKGLAVGPVSLVSPISAAYPLITTTIALLIFSAQLSPRQLMGIALVMIGILLAAEIVSVQRIARKIGTGPRWALIAAISWGLGFALLAQGVNRMGWETATLIELLALTLTFVLLMPFIKGAESISVHAMKRLVTNKFILAAGVIQLLGVLAINIGLSHEAASGAIIVAISACYPVLTIVLAIRNLKENVKLLPLAGAFVSIAGVVILSLG